MARDKRQPTRGQGWGELGVIGGYLLLTVVMTWPTVIQMGAAIPGDGFDGWQNYWNLWWVKVALVERVQTPYTTDLLYYPTGVGLYFHTLNPFNGLVTLPVQLVAGLFAAYNTVVLLSWVLAGYGTYLLARWVIGRALPEVRGARGAALVAGAIFTFAPVHMAHLLGHMQVMALQWLPFYVLALLRGMARAEAGQSWLREGMLAGLFLILAGLCDWYFVLYLFLFTTLALAWTWGKMAWRRQGGAAAWIRPVGPAAVAGIVFAGVLAPILIPMVREALQFSFMVRPASDLYILSASLLDFLVPNRLHTLLRPEAFSWPGNQIAPVSERTISLGYGALLLAGVAVAVAGRRVRFWGVAVICFVLLAMGPQLAWGNITWEDIPTDATTVTGWSPYAVVNQLVPFMRISRSVSRFAIMAQLALAVLAGVGLAWWVAQRRTLRQAAGWIGGVLILVLAESWVTPFPMSPPDTPAYYTELANQPGQGAVLNLPMNYDRPGYLLYQTVHGRPLTVAYISRDDPRTYTERVPFLQHLRHLGPDILADDPAAVGLTVLGDLGVEVVVLDRYKMPGGAEREVTEALAAALFGEQPPTFADERITVYTVTPPAQPQPYLELGPLHWGPLVQEEERRYRAVGSDPAAVWLRHAAGSRAVAVTYRSAAGGAAVNGGTVMPLPPAEQPATVTLTLAAGEDHFTLASPTGELQVERIELLR